MVGAVSFPTIALCDMTHRSTQRFDWTKIVSRSGVQPESG